MIPDFILKQIVTPKNITALLGSVMTEISKKQKENNCLYELRALTVGDDFRIDIFSRRAPGSTAIYEQSYNSGNINELIKSMI